MPQSTTDLSVHVYAFLGALDLCFDNDSAHTQDIPFDDIASALLGKDTANDSANLTNLARCSRTLREALVMTIDLEVRHHGKGIALS